MTRLLPYLTRISVPNRTALAVLLIAGLGVYLRAVNFSNVAGRTPDETVYVRQATALADGGAARFRIVVGEYLGDPVLRLFPPPTRLGYLWLAGLAMRWSGQRDEAGAAWLSIASSIASLLLLAWMALQLLPPLAAASAVALLAVFPPELELARRAWSDALAGFLSLTAVFLLAVITSQHYPPRTSRTAILAGVIGFALAVKESGAVVLAICAAWILWVLARRDSRNALLLLVALVAGACASLAVTAHFVGGFPTLLRVLRAWLLANSTNPYALEYQSGSPFLMLQGFWIVSPLTAALSLIGTITLCVPALRGAVAGASAAGNAKFLNTDSLTWIAIFAASFMAVPMVLPHWLNLRYVSAIFGPLCLLAGAGLAALVSVGRRVFQLAGKNGKALFLAVNAAAALTVALSSAGDYHRFRRMFVQDARGDLSVKILIDFKKLGEAERAVKKVPSARNYVMLCENYIANWRYADALAACQKSLSLGETSPAPWIAITEAYAAREMWPEAATAARKALAIDPANPQARSQLENAEAHLGNGSAH